MNRRDLLRQMGAVGSVGAVTGLAGCTNPFSDEENGGSNDGNGDDDDEDSDNGGDETENEEEQVAQEVSDAEGDVDGYFELFNDANNYLSQSEKPDTDWSRVRSDVDATMEGLEDVSANNEVDVLLSVMEYVDYTAAFFEGLNGMIDELDGLVSDYSQNNFHAVTDNGYEVLEEYRDVKINSHRARQVFNRITDEEMDSVDTISYGSFSTTSSETHRNANAYEQSIEAVVELSDALAMLEDASSAINSRNYSRAVELYDDGFTRFRRANDSLEQLQTWGRNVHRLDESRRQVQCGALIMHEVTEDYLMSAAESAQRSTERGRFDDGESENEEVQEGRDYYNERCPNSPLVITWPSF